MYSKDEWVIDMQMHRNGFFLVSYLQMVLFHFKRGKGTFKVPYDVIEERFKFHRYVIWTTFLVKMFFEKIRFTQPFKSLGQ